MKTLRETKALLLNEMESMLDVAKTETRAFSDKELEQYNRLKAEIEKINATLKAFEEKFTEQETENKGEQEEMKEETRALEELRAITSSTNADVIPTGLHNEIIKKISEKSNVYDEAKKVNYVGDLAVLVDGDNSEATILDETEELTETDLGSFEKVLLKDKRVATLVTISKQVLNNSPVLTMDLIADKVATRVANTIEKQIFLADGGSKKFTSGLLQKGSQMQGEITIENILSMVGGMKSAFLNGSKFYCNRNVFKALCSLVDGAKRPYLVSDVVNNQPSYVLLGIPVVVTDVLADNNLVLANLNEAVMVKHGQEPTIELLQETFALKGSYGFMCEAYVDCAVVNAEAVVVLKPLGRSK